MAGQDQKRGSASKAAAQAPKDSATPEPVAESDPDSAAEASAAGAGDAGSADAGSADPSDDVRRKFRESLQRKQKQQGEHRSADGSGKGGSKVHDGFGPTTGRRSFRRKSGS
ncbi:DUF5302 domain-containing protein [Actinopolymorpha sp. B17G11]|uniref:DUF5302 domain-containing protein n=1 Tax=Actinopolymorpha sp. B17G11 TaxID=3160861 RepID=UPI0032E4E50A